MKQKRKSQGRGGTAAKVGVEGAASSTTASRAAEARGGRKRRGKAAKANRKTGTSQTSTVKPSSKAGCRKKKVKKQSTSSTVPVSAERPPHEANSQAPCPSNPRHHEKQSTQAATYSPSKAGLSPSRALLASPSKAAASSPRTPSRSPRAAGMRVAGAKWSPFEVAALRHTKNATEPTDKYFWFEVASKVSQDCGTHRTAHACVEKYHQLCTKSSGCAERKPPTPKRERNKSKPKALPFSLEDLNFGTNKRKRVLRSMVKKVQENYVDDYFAESGTPEGDLLQSFSFSDDDGFEIAGPVVELESPPSSAPSSPEILRPVDRDEIDGYITQITKKIARGKRSRRSENKLSEGDNLAPKKQRASEEDGAPEKTEEEELPSPWALDKSLDLDSQDEEVSLSEDENDL